MILAVIIIFLIIAGFEVPGLVKNKMWRELMAYCGLMLAGMTLVIMQLLDIPLPNPNRPLEAVFKPVVQWIMKK